MKSFKYLIFLFSIPVFGGTVCSLENKHFAIDYPEGYFSDTEMAENLKSCLVLYPLGSNPKEAPALFRVDLRPIPRRTHWSAAIEKDLQLLKALRVETQPDLLNKNNLLFLLRRAYSASGVEIRAYHEAAGDMLKVTAQVKNAGDLPLYEVPHKSLLQSIKSLEEKEVFPYLKGTAEADAKNPSGKNFNAKFLNSIGEALQSARKSCAKFPAGGAAAVILSENGEIKSWYNETATPFTLCVKKQILRARGTKPPFGPFHLVLDFTTGK